MTINVVRVLPVHMIARWNDISEYLDRAMPVSLGRYESIDMLVMVVEQRAQAWFIFDNDDLQGIAITRIDQYPRRRGFSVFALGAKPNSMADWFDEFDKTLTAFALAEHCDHFEISGRMGWGKALGYVPQSTWAVKDLVPGMTQTLGDAPMRNTKEAA